MICSKPAIAEHVGDVNWDTEMPGSRHYAVRKCEHCQVEFSDPIPSNDVLAEYYSDYKPTQLSEDDPRFQILLELQDPLIDHLSDVLSKVKLSTISFALIGAS